MAESMRPVVDLNKLSQEVDQQLPARIPPSQRLETYKPKRNGMTSGALHEIAANITKLTWTEAERMGAGVEAKREESGSLTAAIQAWATDTVGEA